MATPIQAMRYPFAIDAGGGKLALQTDYEAYIKQLVLQVLLTAPGERINRPTFGAGVRKLVFTPLAESTASLAETAIFEALRTWLGTFIRVDAVQARAQDSTLAITVVYTILARMQQRFLNVEVAF